MKQIIFSVALLFSGILGTCFLFLFASMNDYLYPLVGIKDMGLQIFFLGFLLLIGAGLYLGFTSITEEKN